MNKLTLQILCIALFECLLTTHCQAQTIEVFNYESGHLPKGAIIIGIDTTSDGILWVTVTGGLIKIEDGVWTLYGKHDTNHYIYLFRWLATSGDTVWMADPEEAVYCITQKGDIWKKFNKIPGIINGLLIDSQKRLWVATSSGITLYTNNTWTYFHPANSGLTTSHIGTSMAEDTDGTIWFPEDGEENRNRQVIKGGITGYTKEGEWIHFDTYNSPIPHNKIIHISSDDIGNIYIDSHNPKTQDGAFTIYNTKTKTWRVILPEENMRVADTFVQYYSPQDKILYMDYSAWRTDYKNQIIKMDIYSQTFEYITHDSIPAFEDNWITNVFFREGDNLWLGGQGGLMKISGLNTGVKEKKWNQQLFNLYPNPCHTHFTIQPGNTTTPFKIELLNAAGKKVFETQGMGSKTVNLATANVPPGSYMLFVKTDKDFAIKKLVVE